MDDDEIDSNQVLLRGRLGDGVEVKRLPSGDELLTFRLTVARPAADRGRVDSLECVTTRLRCRRTVERATAGDVLEVSGALRRRFWRTPNGPASRYAVDVSSVRLIRSGRRGGASRGRTRASA